MKTPMKEWIPTYELQSKLLGGYIKGYMRVIKDTTWRLNDGTYKVHGVEWGRTWKLLYILGLGTSHWVWHGGMDCRTSLGVAKGLQLGSVPSYPALNPRLLDANWCIKTVMLLSRP